MAYYLTDTPTAGRGRLRLLVTIAVGLIVLVGLALLVWPTGGGTRAAAPAPAEAALSWALVGEQPVSTSPRAGPARTDRGVAAGFSHDERGAVLAAATVATGYFYRVDGGDPATDRVLVSIAADTPQARAAGGYAAVTRTLRWIDGDWRMQIPSNPARLVSAVTTYHPLGAPRV
jgi:hypothetical protein